MSKQKIAEIAKKAKQASHSLNTLTSAIKNKVLRSLAKELVLQEAGILKANAKDVKFAKAKGLSAAMIDRLILDAKRIRSMASALREIASLADPVGDVVEKRKQGKIHIKKVRIPLGVIGMIYESRPNVTVDAASLCFKSGNAIILRGGSEAFHSNTFLVRVIQSVLKKHGIDPSVVSMIPYTDRSAIKDMVVLDQYIDLVIPRGGEALMRFIVEHTRVPVIKHDKGVCSIYVDNTAKQKQAVEIIHNAKVQRPGVCNALETLYVHQKIAKKFLPMLFERLDKAGVELRGDGACRKIIPQMKKAAEREYGEEYLDLILSVKVVADVHVAIENAIKYSSNHTDVILTQTKKHADLFVRALSSSCVMVNTSTRFNDGGQLGLGAEIGISTTKLHAYGPMGLKELTATKFVVESDYAIRTG
jgi:glutamate-5-semialdehyde dehydrogenase